MGQVWDRSRLENHHVSLSASVNGCNIQWIKDTLGQIIEMVPFIQRNTCSLYIEKRPIFGFSIMKWWMKSFCERCVLLPVQRV